MIHVTDLAIRLGDFSLQEINLQVPEGAYCIILGPTGSGKTVLLECLVGLFSPSYGRIEIGGREVTDLRPEERGLSYVPQDYCLFPHLTVAENIAYGLKVRHWEPDRMTRCIEELADLLHITDILHRRPLHLSGGEKQRAALARALAVEPQVLLLDEPLAAVDEQSRQRLCDELKELQRRHHITVIHVSHNFEETLALADQVAVFNDGRILQTGTPREVFHHPADEFTARFLGCGNIIPGSLSSHSGQRYFRVNDMALAVDTALSRAEALVIRPENIMVLPAGESRAPNTLRATVTGLRNGGAVVRVRLKTGEVPWEAILGVREAAGLRLDPGTDVDMILPPDTLHLLPG